MGLSSSTQADRLIVAEQEVKCRRWQTFVATEMFPFLIPRVDKGWEGVKGGPLVED